MEIIRRKVEVKLSSKEINTFVNFANAVEDMSFELRDKISEEEYNYGGGMEIDNRLDELYAEVVKFLKFMGENVVDLELVDCE